MVEIRYAAKASLPSCNYLQELFSKLIERFSWKVVINIVQHRLGVNSEDMFSKSYNTVNEWYEWNVQVTPVCGMQFIYSLFATFVSRFWPFFELNTLLTA
jgi:hypothetical protein